MSHRAIVSGPRSGEGDCGAVDGEGAACFVDGGGQAGEERGERAGVGELFGVPAGPDLVEPLVAAPG